MFISFKYFKETTIIFSLTTDQEDQSKMKQIIFKYG